MNGVCKYGSCCYRKNPEHLKHYQHPHLDDLLEKYGSQIGSDFDISGSDILLYNIDPDKVNLVKFQIEILKEFQSTCDTGSGASPTPPQHQSQNLSPLLPHSPNRSGLMSVNYSGDQVKPAVVRKPIFTPLVSAETDNKIDSKAASDFESYEAKRLKVVKLVEESRNVRPAVQTTKFPHTPRASNPTSSIASTSQGSRLSSPLPSKMVKTSASDDSKGPALPFSKPRNVSEAQLSRIRSLSKSRYTAKTLGPKTSTSRSSTHSSTNSAVPSSVSVSCPFQITDAEMKLLSFEKRNKLMSDETYQVPATKPEDNSQQNVDSKKPKLGGKICRIIVRQKIGYLIPDNKPQHLLKEVKFKLSDLVNLTADKNIVIEKGSAIHYNLSGKRNASKMQIASKVYVDESSEVKEDESLQVDSQSVYAKKYHRGVVVACIAAKNINFVKPLNQLPAGYPKDKKDVFLPDSNAPKCGFPMKVGDKIEFLLGSKNPDKPMAIKSRMYSYSSRSLETILEFFDHILNNLENKELTIGILSSTQFWSFIASISFQNDNADVYYFLRLMYFILSLFQVSKSYESFCVPIVKIIFASAQLNINSQLFTFINCDNLQRGLLLPNVSPIDFPNICHILTDFFEIGLKLDSSLGSRAFPFVLRIGESETSSRIQMWLIDIIRNIAATGSGQSTSEENWRELTLIPTTGEIKGAPLEDDTLLLPVKGKYNSAEEYMDTYYRLLRTECFSAIQSGIDDLCADELDPRDMNVYHSIYLGGYDVTNSGFSLALQFCPFKKGKILWEKCSNFMFGNLLCISPSGKFEDDHIWATVVNRDVKLLTDHSTIVVQLCSEQNHMSDCQAMMLLWENGGSIVMVESPAYFHSFKPVLESLQKFDMETFPLNKEIVDCESAASPEYLSDTSLLNPTCIFPNEPALITKSEFVHKLTNQQSTLDKSQIRAIQNALSNRLAIIQGPPGCGKTFIGVKLAEIILSCTPAIQGPILVLTYKNHALDEFLKHTLKFLDKKEILRIGGRSKESELDECNLKFIMDNERYDKDTFNRLSAVRDDIRMKIDEIHVEAKRLHSVTQTTPASFVSLLSEQQLRCMLDNAPLKKMKFKLGDNRLADKEWLTAATNNVLNNFGSVKGFLQLTYSQYAQNSDEDFLNKLLRKVIHSWWPSADKMQALKELQSAYLAEIQKAKLAQDDKTNSGENDEDFDEELLESIQENRLASLEGFLDNKKGRSSDNLRLWPKADDDRLFTLKDLPPNLEVNPSILNIDNIWALSEIQRIQLISSVMKTNLEYQSPTFEELLRELSLLQSKKEEIEIQYKVNILRGRRIIGMTIVGASIHHSLLQYAAPEVVIVEEAAEVLEPNLIAALTPGIRHLIMIGDHMQLRPQVDTYKLRKKYKFDTSMMERLVNNDYPFEKLHKQNRMLPEFAELLKDIYPELQNNDLTIKNNKPLTCMEKSMFFWSHDVPEKAERSYRNEEEISRIEQFVKFLIQSGCLASDITVLGAYQGQTTQLRKTIRNHAECKAVIVNTIDMYQGDENKYVIVSLVRSNGDQKIGFLAELNRRCVAQSRAKCGMYFVGNVGTFANSTHWKHFLSQMNSLQCIGTNLAIQCEKHQNMSRCQVPNANELKRLVGNPSLLCSQPCGDDMPCKIKEHACRKPCKPRHQHRLCKDTVYFTFPNCGHASERECCIPQDSLKCKKLISVILPCGHSAEKECWVDGSTLQCKTVILCVYSKCGHKGHRKCCEKEDEVPCKTPCASTMDCTLHNCSNKCGTPHSHSDCQALVDYVFPHCGHPSSKKKKCFAPITWRCKEEVISKAACGHDLIKLCSDNDPMCTHPCERQRNCGHPCTNFCGENCEKKLCRLCENHLAQKIDEERERARKRIAAIDLELGKKKSYSLVIKDVEQTGTSSAEYQKVEDLVLKFVKPEHNWYPKVKKIERVFNLNLERQFEECKFTMHSDFVDYKFHGTSLDGVKGITSTGFRMPPNPGMYGRGIYFATDSSKSAQEMYTKSSNKLLLCKVLLGNTMIVNSADKTLNQEKIKAQGFDSVFAPRGSKATGGVQNDEFIIFDPKQAYPEYIITYETSGIPEITPLRSLPSSGNFKLTTIAYSREFKQNDPYHSMYRFAEGHFYRMFILLGTGVTGQAQRKIKEIDIIQNANLENKFMKKKAEFSSRGIPDKVILGFHGTNPNNIDGIVKNNFQSALWRGQAHGAGNYFSEYPQVSFGYGAGLLLCEILPGKEYQGNGDYPAGYHSKLVQPNSDLQNSAQMVIIRDADQILPRFVLRFN